MTPQRYIPAKRYDAESATQTDNDRRLTELEDRIPKLSTGKSATWNIIKTGDKDTTAANDQRYLKLTADNDPLTGALDIKTDSANALRVLTSASASVFNVNTLTPSATVAGDLIHTDPVTGFMLTREIDVDGFGVLREWTKASGGATDQRATVTLIPKGVGLFGTGTSLELFVDETSGRYFEMRAGSDGNKIISRATTPSTALNMEFAVGLTSTPPTLMALKMFSSSTQLVLSGQDAALDYTQLVINANTGKQAQVIWEVGGVDKWTWYVPTGSDDLRLYNYALIGDLLTLTASSGKITQDFTVDGQTFTRNETRLNINANTAKQAQVNWQVGGADKWAWYVPAGSGDFRLYNYAAAGDGLTITAAGAAAFASTVQGTQLISTIATGAAPLSVASTTVVSNLNADLLDGQHASAFAAAGSYLTALTGDMTASGPGSATATLATVNSNVGSYGSATQVATFTVNAKGLITAAGNTTISGVTPAAHDIAGALHTTSGRTAGQVLQATGATTFDWSTNTLSISGNSTINGSLVGSMTGSGTVATGGFTLTVPATGTAALLGIANTFTGAPQTFRGTAATVGQEFVTINNDSGSYKWRFVNGGNPTTAILFQGYDSTGAVAFQFSAASGVPTFITPVLLTGRSTDTTNAQLQVQQNGNNPYQNWYTSGGQLAATMYSVGAADASKRAVLDLYNITTATIRLHGNGTSYLNGGSVAIGATSAGAKLDVVGTSDAIQLRATGFTTQGNPVALFIDSTAATNTTREALRLEAKSSGTAAAGFGVKQLFHLQSSTTASQTAAYDEWLWTDATHASRTVLYRGTTTGNAVNTGFYGAWAHNAVSNTAITIIPNGTGDVASVGTFVFTVKDNTSATTNGGVVVLNPGGGAIGLISDGTDTLQITCAADGSVTIARSAGTHTFSVSLWGTWQ